MKFKFSHSAAVIMFLAANCTAEVFPQSVVYNGDVELGVVATRKFADAQIGISTTHGAYFERPGLFLGIGALRGYLIKGEYCDRVYPVYADIRKDFTVSRRFSAFIDAKAGHTFKGESNGMLGDAGVDYGFYCFPSVGIRFATSHKCGLCLRLGYTYQSATESWLWYANEVKHAGSHRYDAGGFSASVAFSFR